MFRVSSLRSLTILQIWTQVVRLGFKKFSVEIVFFVLHGRKHGACVTVQGETLLSRSRAHSVFLPGDCLWFVALWPPFVKLKMCLDNLILAQSATAWLPQPNSHHWKGNMVTFLGYFRPHFILDLCMMILLHMWNRTTFCLLRMVRILFG